MHVVLALVAHHSFHPEFGIRSEYGRRDEKRGEGGGFEHMLKELPVILRTKGLQRLGIVVDADLDLSKRWGSLSTTLKKAGYVRMPKLPEVEGTVVDENNMPKVGVWLMPDNRLPGMLEDFLALIRPEGEVLWERAGRSVDDIPREERRFADVHRSKAVIHTYLAWQEEPGAPLGQSITKRSFNPDSGHAMRLISWLSRLFA